MNAEKRNEQLKKKRNIYARMHFQQTYFIFEEKCDGSFVLLNVFGDQLEAEAFMDKSKLNYLVIQGQEFSLRTAFVFGVTLHKIIEYNKIENLKSKTK